MTAALGCTILICIGIIGLVEMIYHVNSDLTAQSVLMLFRMQIDPRSLVPWTAFAFTAAAGALLAWRIFPWVGAIWHATMDEARRRIAG
jgi:hypothetical protein